MRLVGLVLLLTLGLAPLLGAAWVMAERVTLLWSTERIPGAVVAIERDSRGRDTRYYPTVAFTPPGGAEQRIRGATIGWDDRENPVPGSGTVVGDRVSVLYRAATGEALVDDPMLLWALPVTLLVTALLFGGTGAYMRWGMSDEPRRGSVDRIVDDTFRRVGWGTGVAALLCFLLAGALLTRSLAYAGWGTRLPGVIEAMREVGDKGSVQPRIRYQAPDGSTGIHIGPSLNGAFWQVGPGDRLDLLAHPDRPWRRRTDTFFELWLFPLLMVAAGCLLTVVTLILRPRRRVRSVGGR